MGQDEKLPTIRRQEVVGENLTAAISEREKREDLIGHSDIDPLLGRNGTMTQEFKEFQIVHGLFHLNLVTYSSLVWPNGQHKGFQSSSF